MPSLIEGTLIWAKNITNSFASTTPRLLILKIIPAPFFYALVTLDSHNLTK